MTLDVGYDLLVSKQVFAILPFVLATIYLYIYKNK